MTIATLSERDRRTLAKKTPERLDTLIASLDRLNESIERGDLDTEDLAWEDEFATKNGGGR